MLFVAVTWGANLPVTKVMLGYFDLIPLAAIRIGTALATLAVLLWLVEGPRALRVRLRLGRFLSIGLMMTGFFFFYAIGIYYSNPITAAAVQVAGPLVSAATVRLVTGQRFDPGYGVALSLSLMGGLILSSGGLLDRGTLTFRGGEIIVLLSNALWTLYSIKNLAWFEHESQLHRAYVGSLSSLAWLIAGSVLLVELGWSRSPFTVGDPWVWTQLLTVAVLASGLGGYYWNVGVGRLGVAVASLWSNLMPFFAILWSMAYGFTPNVYQIAGGLVALCGVVYMQWHRLRRGVPQAMPT